MARIASVGFCLIAAFVVGAGGCNRNQAQNQGPDPASANMAPADQSGPVEQPADQVAQGDNTAPPAQEPEYTQPGDSEELSQAPGPPPPLPEYSQPPCPGDNYLWTPGYWGYAPAGYYWVPGVWVTAPYVDALWTPPWWGFSGGHYLFHRGYWGPYVGFYGGVNYGFGYTGRGFSGGYWQGGMFAYNRAALNVNVQVVHNVYDRRPINYTPANRVSYNGGNGGVSARPNASEAAALRDRRMEAVPAQVQHQHEAAANRAQFATENRGRPAVTAAPRALAGGFPGRAAGAPSERSGPPMNARPEGRGPMAPNNSRPEMRPPVQAERPANRPGPPAAPQRQGQPTPQRRGEAARSAPEARPPAQQPRETPHAAPAARGPAPQPREAPHPAPAARGPAPQPREAPHPAPAARGPAPQPREAPHPAPAARGPAPQRDQRKKQLP